MIKNPTFRVIKSASAAAFIGLFQTFALLLITSVSANATVYTIGDTIYSSADDAVLSFDASISLGGGPLSSQSFPIVTFANLPSQIGLREGLNSASSSAWGDSRGRFGQSLMEQLRGNGVFTATGALTNRGTFENPLDVDAIPTFLLETRQWQAEVTAKNSLVSGEFGSASLDVLLAIGGGPRQSIASLKSTLAADSSERSFSGFDPGFGPTFQVAGEVGTPTRSYLRVGLPQAGITRDLGVVSAGDGIQIELVLFATAMGNFFADQCDDGTGTLIPCAGGGAALVAGDFSDFNRLRVSWRVAPQAVPLPTTFALLSLGLSSIGMFIRRKV